MATVTHRNRPTNAELDEAYRLRARRLAKEPLATSVRYSRSRDAVLVGMNNGAVLVIPRRLLHGLGDASPGQLNRGMVTGKGTTVSWPEVDADFTVMSLLHGIYGGKRWTSELARRAGATTSEAKAAAARANGAKGGRPRKKAGSRHQS